MAKKQPQESEIQEKMSENCQSNLIQSAEASNRPVESRNSEKKSMKNENLEAEVFAWFEKKGIKAGNIESLEISYTENQRDKVREVINHQKVSLKLDSPLIKKREGLRQRIAFRELNM